MNQESYIYNNARNIRTTLEAVQYMNITLPPTSKARGAIALVNCQELVGEKWQEGRRLYGLVTKMNSEEQTSHILNRGGNLEHLEKRVTQFLEHT
jgi:hypothetical protein